MRGGWGLIRVLYGDKAGGFCGFFSSFVDGFFMTIYTNFDLKCN